LKLAGSLPIHFLLVEVDCSFVVSLVKKGITHAQWWFCHISFVTSHPYKCCCIYKSNFYVMFLILILFFMNFSSNWKMVQRSMSWNNKLEVVMKLCKREEINWFSNELNINCEFVCLTIIVVHDHKSRYL